MESPVLANMIAEIDDSIATLQRIRGNPQLLQSLAEALDISVAALRRGNKLLFAGNGGSAADAQHWAGELVSRFNFDRPGLAALALTTDGSIMTAVGNDYGYEQVFVRQLDAWAVTGDVFFAISTSGRSKNIIRALESCRPRGITTIGFTGMDGGELPPLCDICLCIPSTSTPKIQEGHEVLGHILCGMIEREMFAR